MSEVEENPQVEENPRPRKNPGMMGGGAAQEEGEYALDSVTNEADNMLVQARNAGLGYDEGSQVNVSRQSEQKSSQEGSGEDYEEQQESYAEAEAVDDDTHEGETTTTTVEKIDTEGTIDGSTVIGTQPEEIDYLPPTTSRPSALDIITTSIQYEPSDYHDPTLGNIPKPVGTPLDPMEVISNNWSMGETQVTDFRGTHPDHIPENQILDDLIDQQNSELSLIPTDQEITDAELIAAGFDIIEDNYEKHIVAPIDTRETMRKEPNIDAITENMFEISSVIDGIFVIQKEITNQYGGIETVWVNAKGEVLQGKVEQEMTLTPEAEQLLEKERKEASIAQINFLNEQFALEGLQIIIGEDGQPLKNDDDTFVTEPAPGTIGIDVIPLLQELNNTEEIFEKNNEGWTPDEVISSITIEGGDGLRWMTPAEAQHQHDMSPELYNKLTSNYTSWAGNRTRLLTELGIDPNTNENIEGGLWQQYTNQIDLVQEGGSLWNELIQESNDVDNVIDRLNELSTSFIKTNTEWLGTIGGLLDRDNLALGNLRNKLSNIHDDRKEIFEKYQPKIANELSGFENFLGDIGRAEINVQNYAIANNLYNQQVVINENKRLNRNWEREAEKYRESLNDMNIINELAELGALTIIGTRRLDNNTLKYETWDHDNNPNTPEVSNLTDEEKANANWRIIPTEFEITQSTGPQPLGHVNRQLSLVELKLLQQNTDNEIAKNLLHTFNEAEMTLIAAGEQESGLPWTSWTERPESSMSVVEQLAARNITPPTMAVMSDKEFAEAPQLFLDRKASLELIADFDSGEFFEPSHFRAVDDHTIHKPLVFDSPVSGKLIGGMEKRMQSGYYDSFGGGILLNLEKFVWNIPGDAENLVFGLGAAAGVTEFKQSPDWQTAGGATAGAFGSYIVGGIARSIPTELPFGLQVRPWALRQEGALQEGSIGPLIIAEKEMARYYAEDPRGGTAAWLGGGVGFALTGFGLAKGISSVASKLIIPSIARASKARAKILTTKGRIPYLVAEAPVRVVTYPVRKVVIPAVKWTGGKVIKPVDWFGSGVGRVFNPVVVGIGKKAPRFVPDRWTSALKGNIISDVPLAPGKYGGDIRVTEINKLDFDIQSLTKKIKNTDSSSASYKKYIKRKELLTEQRLSIVKSIEKNPIKVKKTSVDISEKVPDDARIFDFGHIYGKDSLPKSFTDIRSPRRSSFGRLTKEEYYKVSLAAKEVKKLEAAKRAKELEKITDWQKSQIGRDPLIYSKKGDLLSDEIIDFKQRVSDPLKKEKPFKFLEDTDVSKRSWYSKDFALKREQRFITQLKKWLDDPKRKPGHTTIINNEKITYHGNGLYTKEILSGTRVGTKLTPEQHQAKLNDWKKKGNRKHGDSIIIDDKKYEYKVTGNMVVIVETDVKLKPKIKKKKTTTTESKTKERYEKTKQELETDLKDGQDLYSSAWTKSKVRRKLRWKGLDKLSFTPALQDQFLDIDTEIGYHVYPPDTILKSKPVLSTAYIPTLLFDNLSITETKQKIFQTPTIQSRIQEREKLVPPLLRLRTDTILDNILAPPVLKLEQVTQQKHSFKQMPSLQFDFRTTHDMNYINRFGDFIFKDDPEIPAPRILKKPIIPFFPFWLSGGKFKGRIPKLAIGGMYGSILIRPITDLKIFSTSTTQFLPHLKDSVPSTPQPTVTLATETHNPLIQEPMDYVDTRNPTIIPNKIAPQQAPFEQAYTPKESLGEMKFPEQPTKELPPKPEHVTNNDMSARESWQMAFGRPGEDQLGMQINAGTDVFPTINPDNVSSKSITNFMTTNTPKQNVNKASLKNIMKGDFF
jgi:hypothetical protein